LKPIVIFGGFLSFPMVYREMREALAAYTGQPTWVVDTFSHDWLLSVNMAGWKRLLDKLDRMVRQAAKDSSSGKVTLVGHSAGGVLARLYLSPKPFLDRAYHGSEIVDQLITLGSPHLNLGGLNRGGRMSRWVERACPGATFTPRVQYTSVAGQYVCGARSGSVRERWLYNAYRDLCGEGTTCGDGLVPVKSALLAGAEPVILDGVSHFTGFGAAWYGNAEVIPLWWRS
jgi:pimeloyl-ACP methyl ester carboxylesterase